MIAACSDAFLCYPKIGLKGGSTRHAAAANTAAGHGAGCSINYAA